MLLEYLNAALERASYENRFATTGQTGAGKSLVYLGDGKGGFTREQGAEVGETGCRGYHVELADLDGDGAAEVVAGFAGEGSELLGGETCPAGGSLRAWKAVPGKARAGR